MSLRACLLAAALIFVALAGQAAEVRTINPAAFYPEGPLWFNGRLYYVEYSTTGNTYDFYIIGQVTPNGERR